MTVRLQDIADQLSLSVTTVSLALRDSAKIGTETKILVQNTASKMGYIQKSRAASAIGLSNVIFFTTFNSHDSFYNLILRAVETECSSNNLTLHFTQLSDSPRPSDFEEYEEDYGFLLVGSISEGVVRAMRSPRRAIVLVDNNLPHLGLDRILTENSGGVYKAVSRLVELGHQRIGFLVGPTSAPSFRDRLSGYQMAVQDFGLVPQILASNYVSTERADDLYAGPRVLQWLQSQGTERCTALVFCQDRAAIHVANYLQDQGWRVPDDISIVGFDGIPMAQMMRPQLSTCVVPHELMGQMAVRQLIERAADLTAPSRAIVLDTAFVERNSIQLRS